MIPCRNLARTAAISSMILASSLISAAVRADSGDSWYSFAAGSTGTVDETDRKEVEFKGNRALIKKKFDQAEVVLRYDAKLAPRQVAIDLFGLNVRFRDNGPEAQVIVELKKTDMYTGITETIETWDSDSYAPSDDFQQEGTTTFDPPFLWRGDRASYWFSVRLIKTGPGGKPELAIVDARIREQ